MAKITMYPEALELYVYSKIMDFKRTTIRTLKICRLSEAGDGCNWAIEVLDCDLPSHLMSELQREVISPLRQAIDLAPEQSPKPTG